MGANQPLAELIKNLGLVLLNTDTVGNSISAFQRAIDHQNWTAKTQWRVPPPLGSQLSYSES